MDEDPETPVTAAVSLPTPLPAGVPQNWTIIELASLARDLATDMYDRPTILSKYMVTEAECKAVEALPLFQKLLQQALDEWHKPSNINDRLALQAAVGLEITMPHVISRMRVQNEPLQNVVQAGRLLTEIAGASGDKNKAQNSAEKFKIVINLGGEKHVVEKSVTIDNNPTPGEVPTVQPVSQGAFAKPTIPSIARGESGDT